VRAWMSTGADGREPLMLMATSAASEFPFGRRPLLELAADDLSLQHRVSAFLKLGVGSKAQPCES
jgi:hypothetical protein